MIATNVKLENAGYKLYSMLSIMECTEKKKKKETSNFQISEKKYDEMLKNGCFYFFCILLYFLQWKYDLRIILRR